MANDEQQDGYQAFVEAQAQGSWSVLDRVRGAKKPSLRFQFGMKTLLWLTTASAAFFAGTIFQQERDKPTYDGLVIVPRNIYYAEPDTYYETMRMPDGTRWFRHTKALRPLYGPDGPPREE